MNAASRRPAPSAGVLRKALLASGALALVGAAAYAGYVRSQPANADTGLTTAPVTRGDVQSTVPADGRVVVDTFDLDFGAAGRVSAIEVSEGETVTAGQVLATLDDTKAQAQLAQAKTGLASARAKLASLLDEPREEDVAAKQALVDAAKSSLDRAREALDLVVETSHESTVSPSEIQAKSAAVDAAESQVRVAEANLKAAKVGASAEELAAARAAVDDAAANVRAATASLAEYVIEAPVDGVVVKLELTEGQTTSPGGQTPVISVADIAKPYIEGELDESDASAVRSGMPVEVTIDGLDGMAAEGRIERVSQVAQVDQNGLATFAVIVTLDEQIDGLASGMTVRMQVVTDRAADVLMIPTAAVSRRDGTPVVDVLDDSGTVKATQVSLGKTDGKVVEVTAGLTEGQQVVVGDRGTSR